MTTIISDQKISDSTPSTFSRRHRHAVLRREALAQRVERARADVAVDDAEGGEGERGEALAVDATGVARLA